MSAQAFNTFTGLFELRTPVDLVKKLRHDLKRMEASPFDQYAAFDFFITANSLIDWVHPDKTNPRDNQKVRDDFRENNAALRVTAHLADGSKHFHAASPRRRSVVGTEKSRYVEEGYVEDGYFEESLLIQLSQKEAQELGASLLDAISFARQVVELWSKHVPDA